MKNTLRKILATVSMATLLLVMLAVSVAAEIPAKPDGNANLIAGNPVIPADALYGGQPYYIYDGSADTMTVSVHPGKLYYVDYPLDASLTADDTYVISVDVTIPAAARYDEYSGPAFIFRKNTDGKYLGLYVQRNATYCGTFTKAADGELSFSSIGSIDGCMPDGFNGSIKIFSTPTRVNFSVYDENGDAVTLTYSNGLGTIGAEHGWDVSGGAPAFGLATRACKVTFANAEVYDTVAAPTTTTVSGATTTTVNGATTTTANGATTTTVNGATTTTTVATTTTTKPPVDARPSSVPMVSGLKDLIGNNTGFRTAAEGYSYKNGVLTGTGDPVLTREFGRFDLKGVSADDTYLISLNMKVNMTFDEYSGCYIGFRGKDGKDFLAMGFQSNAVYLMDYVSNNYASSASFKVQGMAPFTLEAGKNYKVDIFSTPTKVSLFVDGKLLMDYVTVEKHDAMLSVLSANANFELSNIALYNLSSGAQADSGEKEENSPATGATMPMMAVCVMVAACTGIALTFRRRSCAK